MCKLPRHKITGAWCPPPAVLTLLRARSEVEAHQNKTDQSSGAQLCDCQAAQHRASSVRMLIVSPQLTRRWPRLAGGVVARRSSSRARLKFLCLSSISAHSLQMVARSSTYLNGTCSSTAQVSRQDRPPVRPRWTVRGQAGEAAPGSAQASAQLRAMLGCYTTNCETACRQLLQPWGTVDLQAEGLRLMGVPRQNLQHQTVANCLMTCTATARGGFVPSRTSCALAQLQCEEARTCN